MRVGIPRTLSFFTLYPLLKPFFDGLGVEVVISPASNKALLDEGVKDTVTDACVPIKLFHGHVNALKDKVDFLFMPRLISLDGKSTLCPKFLGLPDMVRCSVANLPEIIDTRLDLKKGKMELYRFLYRVGKRFTDNRIKILRAIWLARYKFSHYRKLLLKGLTPEEAFTCLDTGQEPPPKKQSAQIKLAVLGYPYTIYDDYISVGLLDMLREQGVRVFTAEMVPEEALMRMSKRLRKNLFWYYSNRVVWSSQYYIHEKNVDGIIHVTAFSCGPDSMTNKLVELEAKQHNPKIPFLTITVDEHTGEAGVATRVEAFVDLIKRKKGII
ncbi:MAG: 2-hydroxyglutaryl-CoA dehydratase [Firmicutes bacterium]|nr:2-hydroxyglutaryl-CoA dehydratase [Bacillota bacterium]